MLDVIHKKMHCNTCNEKIELSAKNCTCPYCKSDYSSLFQDVEIRNYFLFNTYKPYLKMVKQKNKWKYNDIHVFK